MITGGGYNLVETHDSRLLPVKGPWVSHRATDQSGPIKEGNGVKF